jgi:hypothetical protein
MDKNHVETLKSDQIEKNIPHPSPIPPAQKLKGETCYSPHTTVPDADPINDLFLTMLTRIFAKKHALSLESSRLVDYKGSSAEEIVERLEAMQEDLRRAQKWIDTANKHIQKILSERNH